MRGRIKHATKQWLNRVYKRTGTNPFIVNELGQEFNDTGAIRDAHVLGFISRVGKGRGNRSIWAIVPDRVGKWCEMEVPA